MFMSWGEVVKMGLFMFFFFKQKTAYEITTGDWSSDVCSSDLNQAVQIGDGWNIIGKTGFFLSGKNYDGAAVVWFLFMMVFMDTTATIPTGALAERWNYKSFFLFSIAIGAVIYPIYGGWVWGGGWLA